MRKCFSEEVKTFFFAMEDIQQSTSTEIESEEVSECEHEPVEMVAKPLNMSPGAVKLRSWLNKTFRVEMTDGRVLTGVFLCTDRDANIILGSCSEYLPVDEKAKLVNEEPRMLGLVMIPGKHIVTIHIDGCEYEAGMQVPLTKSLSIDDIL